MGAETRVLLVEDDRDDYVITRDLLDEIDEGGYRLDWVDAYDAGLEVLRQGRHDVCLLDYRIGSRTGVEFLQHASQGGCTTPIILLTGQGGGTVEKDALAAGAADYLVKGKTDTEALARALRHATERNRALERLRERDRLFRAVFDTTLDGLVIADESGNFVDANPAAEKLLGVARQDVIGRRVVDVLGNRTPQFKDAWDEFIRSGRAAGELSFDRGDGRRRVVEFNAIAHILHGRHFCVLRDITQRREEERARQRLAQIVESADDAVVGTDANWAIDSWNDAATRLFGYHRSEAYGRDIRTLMPSGRSDELDTLLRSVEQGVGVRNYETTRQRKDGSIFEASLTFSVVRDDRGTIAGTSTIVRDITEQNRIRNRLAVSDRMASVGTLAAGVAHEINNPLACVIANLHFSREQLQANPSALSQAVPMAEDVQAALSEAAEAAERVRQTVRDLKLFSRAEADNRCAVDVRRAMDFSVRMVWNEIRHRAQLIRDYGEPPLVDANESRLGQVFMNLLVNAAQAIPEGNAERNFIRIVTREEPGWAVVEVSDSGAGIAPDKLGKIFEPFFTTKPVGTGTGLGLSICHGIISRLGGELVVESAVGEGSTFRVRLPAAVLTGREVPPAREEQRLKAGPRGRILVLDDENILVKSAVRALRDYHDVEGSTDPGEVLRRIGAGERFDVILCDLMMPQLSGMDIYEQLLGIDQRLADSMVFLTGGAFTPRAQAFLEQVNNPRLEKPYELAALLAIIAGLVR